MNRWEESQVAENQKLGKERPKRRAMEQIQNVQLNQNQEKFQK
jgi:hypothetical protein